MEDNEEDAVPDVASVHSFIDDIVLSKIELIKVTRRRNLHFRQIIFENTTLRDTESHTPWDQFKKTIANAIAILLIYYRKHVVFLSPAYDLINTVLVRNHLKNIQIFYFAALRLC